LFFTGYRVGTGCEYVEQGGYFYFKPMPSFIDYKNLEEMLGEAKMTEPEKKNFYKYNDYGKTQLLQGRSPFLLCQMYSMHYLNIIPWFIIMLGVLFFVLSAKGLSTSINQVYIKQSILLLGLLLLIIYIEDCLIHSGQFLSGLLTMFVFCAFVIYCIICLIFMNNIRFNNALFKIQLVCIALLFGYIVYSFYDGNRKNMLVYKQDSTIQFQF
jgi:hypothetical protein